MHKEEVCDQILIGDLQLAEINIVGEDGELLASISSKNIIEKTGTTVILVPSKN